MQQKYSKNLRFTHMKLWTLASKFTKNSRVVGKIAEYIEDHFLNANFVETLPNGVQILSPMFEFAPPRKGRPTPYFNPKALDEFKTRYGRLLKHEAEKAEQEQEYISIRSLTRLLFAPSSFDLKLREFINEKCMDDTFEYVDENQNTVEKNIFFYDKNIMGRDYLLIRKDGFHAFVKKHEQELFEMGIKSAKALAHNLNCKKVDESILTPGEIAKKLFLNPGSDAYKNFMKKCDSFFSKIKVQKQKDAKPEPLFQDSWCFGPVKCLKEENLPLFLKRFEKELISLGISQSAIDHHLKREIIHEVTPENITFSNFLRKYIRSNPRITKTLIERIKKDYLDSTYTTIVNHKEVKKPVFIKVRAKKNNGYNYVFAHKEALLQFTKNNPELFKSSGISKFIYQNILNTENPITTFDNAIAFNDLFRPLNLVNNRVFPFLRSLEGKQFPVLENGVLLHKQFIVRIRKNNHGAATHAILKDGLYYILSRYQNELKICDATLEALRLGKAIVNRTDDMFSIGEFARLFHKSNCFAPKFSKFILNKAVFDTYETTNENGIVEEKPMVTYALANNGQTNIYIPADAILPFIEKYKDDLLNLGIRPHIMEYVALKIKENKNTFYQPYVQERKLASWRRNHKNAPYPHSGERTHE